MIELCNIYKTEVDRFISDSVRNLLFEILHRWGVYASDEKLGVVFSIVEPAYPEFRQFVQFARASTLDFDDDMPSVLTESIRRAFIEDCLLPPDRKHNSYIPLDPKDVVDVIRYLMRTSNDKCMMDGESGEIAKKYFNNVLSNLITYTTMIIRMTNPTIPMTKEMSDAIGTDMRFDDPRLLCDTFMARTLHNYTPEQRRTIRRSRALEVTHVLCMGTMWIPDLVLPTDPIRYATDSSRLMTTLLRGSYLTADMNGRREA
jgi:hypothetical protein